MAEAEAWQKEKIAIKPAGRPRSMPRDYRHGDAP